MDVDFALLRPRFTIPPAHAGRRSCDCRGWALGAGVGAIFKANRWRGPPLTSFARRIETQFFRAEYVHRRRLFTDPTVRNELPEAGKCPAIDAAILRGGLWPAGHRALNSPSDHRMVDVQIEPRTGGSAQKDRSSERPQQDLVKVAPFVRER